MTPDHHQRVVITGVRMPFWSMVELLVTIALASIPALILVSVVLGFIGLALASLVATFGL